jgi:hypothetical protein
MPGLDGGDGLPGYAGYPRKLLLRQAAGLPGQPQLSPVRLGPVRLGPVRDSACIAARLRHARPPVVLPGPRHYLSSLYDLRT